MLGIKISLLLKEFFVTLYCSNTIKMDLKS